MTNNVRLLMSQITIRNCGQHVYMVLNQIKSFRILSKIILCGIKLAETTTIHAVY